jgi:stearoyl-CoA desaturase (delta-9 desaturase)
MRDTALARYVPDLQRDAFHRWLERWHIVPMLVLSVALAAWGATRGGVFLAASLVTWGIFLRTTVELHGTWLVNSAAHTWGSRRFATPDDSTNNWWVALLTFGEGWHNNHHADPRSVRHGLAWYELDINWLCIRALRQVGLARKLCMGTANRLHPPASLTSHDPSFES